LPCPLNCDKIAFPTRQRTRRCDRRQDRAGVAAQQHDA
jgi:hypothetical protein